jgi:hypothetical protein
MRWTANYFEKIIKATKTFYKNERLHINVNCNYRVEKTNGFSMLAECRE